MKMLLEIIKWVALILGGLLLFVFISLLVYRTYVEYSTRIDTPQVPVYFFEGKYDMANPTILVEDFIDKLDDGKDINLIIFEKSGHFPMIEEKEKYQDQLVNVVLKENQNE